MEKKYIEEQFPIDQSELEKEKEIIMNISKVRNELKNARKNFEYAENELVDYYIYQIKANQAKLNYLLRLAKMNGIKVNLVEHMKYKGYRENIS